MTPHPSPAIRRVAGGDVDGARVDGRRCSSVIVLGVLALACAGPDDLPRAATSDASGSEVGGLPPPVPVPDPRRERPDDDDTTDDGTTDDAGADGIFIVAMDMGPSWQCSIWEEDCPRGEKCMPWANDGGGSWNGTRCSPIDPDAVGVGEACVVERSAVSGIDNCELHAMCWDVDPYALQGVCVPMCSGYDANPTCPDGFVCAIGGDALPMNCLPACHPLLAECLYGWACHPFTDVFVCSPDYSGGAGAGTPCEFVNVCTDGTACINAESVPDCPASAGCCSSFCALDDPDPPCLPGQACTAWYSPGRAPLGFEQLGICEVPS